MFFFRLIRLGVIFLCMVNTCFSSPIASYINERPGLNGIRLVNGKIYWDNNESSDEIVQPVNGSYSVGPLYQSLSNGARWWEGTPNAGISLNCQGFTYKECSKKWIERFGKDTPFTIGVNSIDEELCLGFGVGLLQPDTKLPFPDSVCIKIPRVNLRCSVNTSALNIYFATMESKKYDGEFVDTPMKVKCTGGDSSVSIIFGAWELPLTNGTSARFSITSGGNTISENGHLMKITGDQSVVLKTVLHGVPKIAGAFSGSTFMIFNYE